MRRWKEYEVLRNYGNWESGNGFWKKKLKNFYYDKIAAAAVL